MMMPINNHIQTVILILSFKHPICQACRFVFRAIDLIIKPRLYLCLLEWNVVTCWPGIGFRVEPCCEKNHASTDDKLITLSLAIFFVGTGE